MYRADPQTRGLAESRVSREKKGMQQTKSCSIEKRSAKRFQLQAEKGAASGREALKPWLGGSEAATVIKRQKATSKIESPFLFSLRHSRATSTGSFSRLIMICMHTWMLELPMNRTFVVSVLYQDTGPSRSWLLIGASYVFTNTSDMSLK